MENGVDLVVRIGGERHSLCRNFLQSSVNPVFGLRRQEQVAGVNTIEAALEILGHLLAQRQNKASRKQKKNSLRRRPQDQKVSCCATWRRGDEWHARLA
jgi:hypothetical protein